MPHSDDSRSAAADIGGATTLLDALHAAQAAVYGGGDDQTFDAFDAFDAIVTDDITWHVPGRNRIAGTYTGRAEVADYLRRRRALCDETLRLHRRVVFASDGDYVAALTDGTAVLHGMPARWSTIGLYRVREGRISECWLLPLDPAEFDRCWS